MMVEWFGRTQAGALRCAAVSARTGQQCDRSATHKGRHEHAVPGLGTMSWDWNGDAPALPRRESASAAAWHARLTGDESARIARGPYCEQALDTGKSCERPIGHAGECSLSAPSLSVPDPEACGALNPYTGKRCTRTHVSGERLPQLHRHDDQRASFLWWDEDPDPWMPLPDPEADVESVTVAEYADRFGPCPKCGSPLDQPEHPDEAARWACGTYLPKCDLPDPPRADTVSWSCRRIAELVNDPGPEPGPEPEPMPLDEQLARLVPFLADASFATITGKMRDRRRILGIAVKRLMAGHAEYGDRLMRVSDVELARELDEELADAVVYRSEQLAREAAQ